MTEIGTFFQNLCSRTLTEDEIQRLDDHIAILLCNLGNIFPPSVFNGMENFPIHLPHEATLGVPVQFRWMSPFKRYMKNLKDKKKTSLELKDQLLPKI